MKSKSSLAMAVAGAFACSTGAYAGSAWNAHEVQTPSSVNESAPWLANEGHMPSSGSSMSLATVDLDRSVSDSPIAAGSASSMRGAGLGAYSTGETAHTEYWLLGSESADIGVTSGVSGAGHVGFDSSMTRGGVELESESMRTGATEFGSSERHFGLTTSPAGYGSAGFEAPWSGELTSYSFEPAASAFEMVLFTPTAADVIEDMGHATPFVTRHYLIPADDSAYDPSEFTVIAIGPGSQDVALLNGLKEHFIIVTPVYGGA